jgi:hypothetical protein
VQKFSFFIRSHFESVLDNILANIDSSAQGNLLEISDEMLNAPELLRFE